MRFFKRNTCFLVLLCLSLQACPNTAWAQEIADLRSLASSFVQKLSPQYKDLQAQKDALDQIPEGSSLLLRPRSEKVVFDGEIYSFKRNNAIYMALEDFIELLEFNVGFDNSTLKGSGWFLREDWHIDIDIPHKKVVSRGVTYNIDSANIFEEDGIVFVKDTTLAKWFGLSFDYDIEQQFIDIESAYPLPSVARNLRQTKGPGSISTLNEPVLPRLEQEKQLFDLNVADVSLGTSMTKQSSGDALNRQYGNVTVEGELLKHNAYVFSAADSDNNLSSVVARLSKRSEDPDLLGPLNARSYAIGDIEQTDMPLTGNTSQDLGFRFDNNPLENTDFATTNIVGDGLPGWDVELYREGILLDTLTIDNDGRYEFNNVQLFLDDNTFELFFYGPQGEIRSEEIQVPVTADLLRTQDKTYEFSVSFEDTQTFENTLTPDQDQGAMHVAGRYNKLLGDETLGYVGFRSRQVGGERKDFLSSGISTIVGQTILDTNFAVDEDASIAGEALLRQNIDDWNLSLRAKANSDGFAPDDITDPLIREFNFSASKPLGKDGNGIKGNVLLNALHQETVAGSMLDSVDAGFSQQFNRTNLSHRLTYENSDIVGGVDNEDVDYTLSARRIIGLMFTRFGATYNITPDSELESLFGQVNYRYNSKFSTDVSLQHQLDNELTTGRLNLNYIGDKIRTSPFVEMNSDDRIYAGVNLNFSLIDPAYEDTPIVTSRRQIGRGLVSAHVFLDKNGNLIFDEGDEPIKNATVESVNTRRSDITNAQGYTTLKELTTTRPTDIRLVADTLPDPFMIPAFEGRSIFPEAGSMIKMEFPVHMSGELDGAVYYLSETGSKQTSSYHGITLTSLDHPDRKVFEARSETDGYYLMYLLPPGRYLLNTEPKSRAGKSLGNTTPQIVTIGYEGTILSNQDIQVTVGQPYIPYEIHFAEGAAKYADAQQYTLKVKRKGASKLSELISGLLSKRLNKSMIKDLTRIADKKTEDGVYEQYTDSDLQKLHHACVEIKQTGITCAIEVFVPAANQEVALR